MALAPSRPRRRAAAALSIAACISGAASLQTPPAVGARFRSTSRAHHQSLRWRTAFVAAAAGNGYDDWFIDEDDATAESNGGASHAKEPSSKLGDSGRGDDDSDVRSYFATCIPGLQETLASELVSLGASRVETQGKSGVRFEGSPTVGLKSILWCRTAHKIMELIASSTEKPAPPDEFDLDYGSDFSAGIRNREDLYGFVKTAVHTPSLLGDGSGGLLTLSVNTIYASRAPNKELCHGHFTALTVKNALVDSVRDLREDGDRPDVDVDDPDVPLVVVLKGRRASEGNGRRGRRDDRSYGEEEEEMVADVDLYRCLHPGGSLHRRGYRRGNLDPSWDDNQQDEYSEWEADSRRRRPSNNGEAPIHRAAMKESLAAGLLLQAGWDKLVNAARGDGKGAVLVDPMTGSGTLPTEAALIACDVAPGLLRIAAWRGRGDGRRRRVNPHRRPPCVRWKDFSAPGEWDALLAGAARRARSGTEWARSSSDLTPRNVRILCNEANPRAAGLARTSVRNAGMESIISLAEGDCAEWDLGGGEGSSARREVLDGRTIFACNPPWGLRLTDDIDGSWVALREFLRREARGCECWVLSGNKDLTKILRMRTSRKVPIRTAEEDLRWLQYHIFQRAEVKAS